MLIQQTYVLLDAIKASKKVLRETTPHGPTVFEVSIWSEKEMEQLKQALLTELKLKTN